MDTLGVQSRLGQHAEKLKARELEAARAAALDELPFAEAALARLMAKGAPESAEGREAWFTALAKGMGEVKTLKTGEAWTCSPDIPRALFEEGIFDERMKEKKAARRG